MHTKLKLLIPAGAVAAIVLAACTVPPPTKPPVKPPPTTKPPTPTTKPTLPPPPSCPTPAANSTPGPDSENPISSWGIDGIGYTTVAIGNVVYVGGSFSNAVSTNGSKKAHSNLAAFCIKDGSLLDTFVANFNGPVYALTTDGANLFVGGNFNSLNGASVNRIVKLNPLTGARFTAFNPLPIPNPVYALDYAASGPRAGSVFVGGDFSVNGKANLGKKGTSVDHNSGAATGWNPNADALIQALKVSPDGNSVYIGGTFVTVGGQPHGDLARTAATNGAVSSAVYGDNTNPLCEGGPANSLCGHVFSIAVASNNATIYVSTGPSRAKGSNGGNKLYSFSSGGGAENWVRNFDGDDQAVVVTGSTIYTGFHGGYQNNTTLRVLGFTSSGTTTSFSPASGGVLGVRGLALGSGGNRLIAVGDFSNMGSTNKLHGLAIFN